MRKKQGAGRREPDHRRMAKMARVARMFGVVWRTDAARIKVAAAVEMVGLRLDDRVIDTD